MADIHAFLLLASLPVISVAAIIFLIFFLIFR